jgi:hypothetical protein
LTPKQLKWENSCLLLYLYKKIYECNLILDY